MRTPGSFQRLMYAASAIAASVVLGPISGADAHSGEFKRFDACPSVNPEVEKCLSAEVVGGMAQMGSLNIPFTSPMTIRGGIAKAKGVERFIGASDGVTLLAAPQPVPGGLAGILAGSQSSAPGNRAGGSAPEIGLNQVFARFELARPAGEIGVGVFSLLREQGTVLRLPVQVHLENPLLGASCRIGSSASPIILNMTAGETNPPPPNLPIHGDGGRIESRAGGEIALLNGSTLVDNAWSAPQPEHCGIPSLAATVGRRFGSPSPAGHNAVILQTAIYLATAFAVNSH